MTGRTTAGTMDGDGSLLDQIQGFVQWIADGHKLTQTSRLPLTDARVLVPLLATGDRIPEHTIRLTGIAKPRTTISYEYDFGDGWDHTVLTKPAEFNPPAVGLPATRPPIRPNHRRAFLDHHGPTRNASFRMIRKEALHSICGAKGTRTPNPLLAKQVRYQLRHGPVRAVRLRESGRRTVPRLWLPGKPDERFSGRRDRVGRLGPEVLLRLVGLDLPVDQQTADGSHNEQKQFLHVATSLLVDVCAPELNRSGAFRSCEQYYAKVRSCSTRPGYGCLRALSRSWRRGGVGVQCGAASGPGPRRKDQARPHAHHDTPPGGIRPAPTGIAWKGGTRPRPGPPGAGAVPGPHSPGRAETRQDTPSASRATT